MAVPKNHPFAAKKQINLQEAASEPFIMLEAAFTLRLLSDQFCELAGISPDIIFEGADIFSVAGLVRAGLGIALLPKIPALASPELVFLPISFPVCQRAIGIAWNTTATLPPSAAIFQRFVLNRYIQAD